jgi:hypothetical protein
MGVTDLNARLDTIAARADDHRSITINELRSTLAAALIEEPRP